MALLIHSDGALMTRVVVEATRTLRIPIRLPVSFYEDDKDIPYAVRTFRWRCTTWPYQVYEEQI